MTISPFLPGISYLVISFSGISYLGNVSISIPRSFDDIPLKEMEEAICDCCEAAGLKFENFDDILRQL